MVLQHVIALLNIMDKMFFVNLFSSIDHAILGLTLVLYPNAFWLEKALDTTTTTAFEDLSSDLSMIATMGTGTLFLAVFLYHVFYLHDYRDEQVLLRLKMVNYICQLLLTVRSAIMYAPTPWLMGRLVVDLAMTLWLAHTLFHSAFAKTRTSFKSVQTAVLLETAYYLSIGYIAFNAPAKIQQPDAGETGSVVMKPFWKSDALVAFSWQGIHLFAMLLVLLWNVQRVPQADAKILLIQNVLFLLVLVWVVYQEDKGHQDSPNMFVHSANHLFLVAHACMTFLVWKMSNSPSLRDDFVHREKDNSSSSQSRKPIIHEKEKVA